MAEAPLEYVNIKMWEEKQSQEITSTMSWEGNKLGNIAALVRRSLSSCSLLSDSLVLFSRGIRPIFALFALSTCHFKIPPSLQLFLVLPSPWNVYVFIFKWIFQHQSVVFAFLPNRFSLGWYGAECDIWGVLFSPVLSLFSVWTV